MKNLALYYTLIIVPLATIFFLEKMDLINGTIFLSSFIFYALIYRTYVDGKRLSDKNIIPKKDIWKMIIPGRRIAYFRELYMK